jgi:hypothetical protein
VNPPESQAIIDAEPGQRKRAWHSPRGSGIICAAEGHRLTDALECRSPLRLPAGRIQFMRR